MSQQQQQQQQSKREEQLKEFRQHRERLEEFADPFKALLFDSPPTKEELDRHRFKFRRMGLMCCVDAEDYEAFESLVDRRYEEALRLVSPSSIEVSKRLIGDGLFYRFLYFVRHWILALYGSLSILIAFAIGSTVLHKESPAQIPFSLLLFGGLMAAPLSLTLIGRREVTVVGSLVALCPACLYHFSLDAGFLRGLADLTSLGQALIHPLAGYLGALGALGYLRWRREVAQWEEVERELKAAAGTSRSFNHKLALPQDAGHYPTFEPSNVPLRNSGKSRTIKPDPSVGWNGTKYYSMAALSFSLWLGLATGAAFLYRDMAGRSHSADIRRASARAERTGFSEGRKAGIEEGKLEARGPYESLQRRYADLMSRYDAPTAGRLRAVKAERDAAVAKAEETQQEADARIAELNGKIANLQPAVDADGNALKPGYKTVEVCMWTGLLPQQGCQRMKKILPISKLPQQFCSMEAHIEAMRSLLAKHGNKIRVSDQ